MPFESERDEDFYKTVFEVYQETGSKRETGRRLGVNESSVRYYLKKAALRGLDRGNPPEGFEVRRVSEGPHGRTVVSGPELGPQFVVPDDRRVGKITHTVEPDGRLGRQWFRTHPEDDRTADWVKRMNEAFATVPAVPVISPPEQNPEDLMSLYPIADLHFNQRSYAQQAGEEYNQEIAARLVDEKMSQLVAMAPASSTALLVILGDALNANDRTGATPKNKHKQDEDQFFGDAIFKATELFDRHVMRLLQKHQEVEVIPLKGNHDPDAYLAYAIGLHFRYRDNPRVNVRMVHSSTFYYEWGRSLMGFTHGDEVDPKDLLRVMTGDVGPAFGRASWHFFFSAHRHQEKVTMDGKLKCRTFAPITPRSAYAAGRGLHNTREFTVLTFHKETGPFSELPIYLPPPPSREVIVG